jgi:hypothetical protein
MFRVKIKIMETKPHDVSRDAWRVMQRNGMLAVGQWWFKEILPNHFTPQARHLYGHKPRSKKYRDQKEKLAARGKAIMGGKVDNVLTGAMMRAIMSRSVIRGFPTRATVYMNGPHYTGINFRASSNQPNKPQEIRATTKQEIQEGKKLLRRFMLDQLKKHRTTPKTTTV